MKIHLLPALFLVASATSAQTRKIAFESHSGSAENYKIAIDQHLFDIKESDFGLPPKEIKTYRLDSVIYVSGSTSIVVTSEYSRAFSDPADSNKFTRKMHDTLMNNELFSRNHSLDSIKSVLRKDGYYTNSKSLNKVVFVGYDNKRSPRISAPPEKNNLPLPVLIDPPSSKSPPMDPQVVWMIGAIFFLSLFGGWVSWKLYRPKLS
jgi:hypothetical protein